MQSFTQNSSSPRPPIPREYDGPGFFQNPPQAKLTRPKQDSEEKKNLRFSPSISKQVNTFLGRENLSVAFQ